jgi:hypothetical protein
VTKTRWKRAVGISGVIIVVIVVGLAVRSVIPSRTVGHGAFEQTCFDLSSAGRTHVRAVAQAHLEDALDAASRAQAPTLAAEVSRVSKLYADPTNQPALTIQGIRDALTECTTLGWKPTDPCTFGPTVCGA